MKSVGGDAASRLGGQPDPILFHSSSSKTDAVGFTGTNHGSFQVDREVPRVLLVIERYTQEKGRKEFGTIS